MTTRWPALLLVLLACGQREEPRPRRAAPSAAAQIGKAPVVTKAPTVTKVADAGPSPPAAAAAPTKCFPALPGNGDHGGNEDGTSFDLAFVTTIVRGGTPVEVGTIARLPDFADGDEYIPAPPGAKKLFLKRPVRAWFHGPVSERCVARRGPAAGPALEPRASAEAPATREWARSARVLGAPTNASRLPRAAADELGALVTQLQAGATLRWVRVLAPAAAEGGAAPPLLVAAHHDRRRGAAMTEDDAGAEAAATLGMILAVVADDGQRMRALDVATGRMRTDVPWSFGPTLLLDDDPHPDTILLAPSERDGGVQDGVAIALTSWKTVSIVPVFSYDEPPPRQQTCLGRVDGRPALLVGFEGDDGAEGPVRAWVADAGGHLVAAPGLFGAIHAWAHEPGTFVPPHRLADYAQIDGPLTAAELRSCPLDGDGFDRAGTEFARYGDLSTTRDGVEPGWGIRDLQRPLAAEGPGSGAR